MPDLETRSPRERPQEPLYVDSYKRLTRRGLTADAAARIAAEVARRTAERAKTPDFGSDQELASTVYSVCKGLSEGKSYYHLSGDRPYLVNGRIDRLVAVAGHVRPEVPAELVLAARKATALERLAGGLAVLFTAVALAALGIWPALGIGVAVSAGAELYVQTGMSPAARRTAARYRVPRWLGIIAVVLLVWAGYSWLRESGYPAVTGCGLALFAMFVASVVPGFTFALLVGLRERRWRSTLEKQLMDKELGDSEL